jgi:hypothetical protein
MPKICDEPGCQYPVFSRGLCRIHWQRKHGKPVAKISRKRKRQLDEYSDRKRAFIANKKAEGKGKLYCGFTGERVYGDPDIHHAVGRDDETLLDERYWHIACRKNHTEWHSLPVDKILWFDRYLEWLGENMPPEAYFKALKQKEKS